MTALAEVNRPATFIVPPSIVNCAPVPAPITWVPTVPMLNVPALTRSKPLLVGLPIWPNTVALALLRRKPPVAGIV